MLTLLVATVPVVLGAWMVASDLGVRERNRADGRLRGSLTGARAELRELLAAADRRARRLATETAVQRAILASDRRAAARLVRGAPTAVLYARGRRLAGAAQPDDLLRSVTVLGRDGRVAGRVAVRVPFDAALLARLQERAPAVLLLSRSGRVTTGPFGAFAPVPSSGPGPETADIAGRSYRIASLALPGERALLATLPAAEIESAAAARTRDVALAALATLLTILVAAEALVPLLRRRGAGDEELLELLGGALAAAHDRGALLPIALESVVEATGAVGGVLYEDGVEVARLGEAPALAEPMKLSLAKDGGAHATVLVYPPVGGFTRAQRRRAERLAEQVTVAVENARQHEIAALEAVTDPLTGLANRRRFTQRLAAEAERRRRSGQPVSVIAADLDDFKAVNDRFGHEAGDDVLRAFARLLRGTVREIDVAARLGGEEFAVLLPETDAAGAEALAERLRERLVELKLVAPDGRLLSVTASFGFASAPPLEHVEELLPAADEALYAAKQRGKNRVSGARS